MKKYIFLCCALLASTTLLPYSNNEIEIVYGPQMQGENVVIAGIDWVRKRKYAAYRNLNNNTYTAYTSIHDRFGNDLRDTLSNQEAEDLYNNLYRIRMEQENKNRVRQTGFIGG